MNVFVDSNILLGFYAFSNERLDSLENALGLHAAQQVTLWLTEQVGDEVERNRDQKIAEALKLFEQENQQVPRMALDNAAFAAFHQARQAFSQAKNQLIQALRAEVSARELKADSVIAKLFEHANVIAAPPAIIERAKVRYDRGNPPGKANSYGDAIHWECLLEAVPHGQDLFLISDDQDYRSKVDDSRPNSFLAKEWKEKKDANLHLFRRMSLFLAQHAEHAEALAAEERDASIRSLRSSPNFATTHAVVAELQSFPHFSNEQAAAIVEASLKNPQVSWIIGDPDVEAFMQRILNEYGPHVPQADREALEERLAAVEH